MSLALSKLSDDEPDLKKRTDGTIQTLFSSTAYFVAANAGLL
jgi:hypothetical protein|tara:strand:- start:739 stop:864 length:126 start_codon:yes stop_codon:yes gene_type:complete